MHNRQTDISIIYRRNTNVHIKVYKCTLLRIERVRSGVETSLPFVFQMGIIEVSVTSRDDKGVIFYNDLSQWG